MKKGIKASIHGIYCTMYYLAPFPSYGWLLVKFSLPTGPAALPNTCGGCSSILQQHGNRRGERITAND